MASFVESYQNLHKSLKILNGNAKEVNEKKIENANPSFHDNIRASIIHQCDLLIQKIENRKIELLRQLEEFRVVYEESIADKNEEYISILKAKRSIDKIYKDSPRSEFYIKQQQIINEQFEKLSESTDMLIHFVCCSDESEQKLNNFGSLELVLYDYKSKCAPVVATGSSGIQPGSLNWPRGVGVDPNSSNIYIANYKNNRVEVFSRKGSFLFNFGGPKDIVKLSCPHGICIRNDRVYVLEAGLKGRLICFKLNGEYDYTCSRIFEDAGRISCTPKGQTIFYIVEHNRIIKLDQNLEFLGKYVPNVPLNRIVDIKIYDDEVFILDTGDTCMHVFDMNGKFLRDISISRGPVGKQVINPQNFAIDPFGRLIVCASNSHCVLVFTPNGRIMHRIGKQGSKPGEFKYPNSLCIDTEGRIITVNERNSNGLQIF